MQTAILTKQDLKEIALPILGCALLLIGASIRIPFYPVPLTLHTFALFLIALTQSPKQALNSVIGYLLVAMYTNPFWWMGKCAGYFLAFPIAAYGIAALREKFGNFPSLAMGASFILFCGFIWLIPLTGLSVAFKYGLAVFIPSELAKILVILSLKRRFG